VQPPGLKNWFGEEMLLPCPFVVYVHFRLFGRVAITPWEIQEPADVLTFLVFASGKLLFAAQTHFPSCAKRYRIPPLEELLPPRQVQILHDNREQDHV
jgi:hypothetical protein